MSKGCVWMPSKGQETFKKLKKEYGRPIAAVVFNKITGTQFQKLYKDSLTFDSEGVPTFESIMKVPIVRKYIGESKILESYNKDQPHLNDTTENTATLVNKAYEFNKSNKDYVAVVDYDDEGKLTIKVLPNTKENNEWAKSQYNIQKLNEAVANILSPLGITIGELSKEEVAAGRVGLTNFAHAQEIANQFTGLIQVANNMEGAAAISEEFSHFIVGIFRDSPLVQRSINYLKDEKNVREVLGEQYNEVSEYYNGDADLIAEEAVGHVFRQSLLDRINKTEEIKQPLFKRMTDFIVNLFKGLNPAYYQDTIDRVNKDLGQLADDVLSQKKTITKQDVFNAKREVKFNALSERCKAQIKVLKNAEERSFKAAALQENLDELRRENSARKDARIIAEKISKVIKDNLKDEETMAAIAAYLDVAVENIEQLFKEIQKLDNLDVKDKFTVLRNALYTIQSYGPTIDELVAVTTEEYLTDEDISMQNFMVDDTNNILEEFENDGTEDVVDTSSMSTEDIAERIQKDANEWELAEDETYYVNKKDGRRSARVTTVIAADSEGEEFDKDSAWVTPSTNIGTGVDEQFRDTLSGRVEKADDGSFNVNGKPLDEVYPNATKEDLEALSQQALDFKAAEEAKGITLIARDVVASGTIQTVDGAGRVHTINVAGTLDLLGYDNEGNWYIYDMKTHHGNIDSHKKAKYERQVTLYKQFLEKKYGIKIKSLNIIPIKVSYPNPVGTSKGTTVYSVSSNKPTEYQGRYSNQLLADGEEFKSAHPTMEPVMEVHERESNIQYKKLAKDSTNGLGSGVSTIKGALDDVNRLYKEFIQEFQKKALPEFIAFLKPFVGENIQLVGEDGKVSTVSIAKVIMESSSDVTMMQRWFSSMADNPDALLQIFDYVVKKVKDEHRIKTIEKAQEIIALGKEYEAKGITDYDWMYEDDKQNYINEEYDTSKYREAKKAFFATLDEKYGAHPSIGSEEYRKKRKEQQEWVRQNTIARKDTTGGFYFIPNPDKYPSRWNSLNATQKEFFNKWMQLKTDLDTIIGPEHTTPTNTIKIRKSGIERIKGAMSGDAISNFVESAKAKLMKSFDDDTNYENAKGIRGFNNEEIMKLPLYYLNSKDTKDLSTDAIGTLVAYAEMAYNYEAMSKVVNPLEIGREIITMNKRRINSTRHGKKLMEEFNFAGRTVKNPIYEDVEASNFKAMLDDFFESKIYGRYLKDAGEIAGIDANKAASILLKLGSTVQLGFNLLANIANAATGLSMQNIEAAAGEHFSARELLKADTEFMKAMGSYVGDIGQRALKSKLALFDQMFDVRQNFKKNIKDVSFLNKTILTRIFGPGIQYIGQDAGDHWLYNRTAIAIALRHKLKDNNGDEISLWDALEVVPIDSDNPDAGNQLVLKEGVKNLDGSNFSIRDISDISGNMRYVNQHLFGIYNDEDSIGARRVIWGRFLMQYRDWIPAQFRYRFGSKTTNLEKGDMVEGYYRTTGRFIKQIYKELKNGEKTIGQVWDSLEDYERANLKRATTEVMQWLVICAMASLLGGKDKDRPWAERALGYSMIRLRTELGALVPFSMPKEMLAIARSPFAATNVLSDISSLLSLLNPMSYTDEIESGDYKGHSSAYRAFMKSPLTLWYKTIKRATQPEKAEQYYNQ